MQIYSQDNVNILCKTTAAYNGMQTDAKNAAVLQALRSVLYSLIGLFEYFFDSIS